MGSAEPIEPMPTAPLIYVHIYHCPLKSIYFFRYTATKGFEGPVFGSSDKWNGLGVFFDSFDNDNKHNNPYIMVRFIYKLSIFQGPHKSGWHGWHATRQFQPTGGCHPSNKATVVRHPPIFSIFIYFNRLLTDYPPVI